MANRIEVKEEIRIRMRKTVRAVFIFSSNIFLETGKEYPATTNKYGAISGVCDNGELLGVRPGEFEFISAPEWVLFMHGVTASGESL
jgi:hypothetical protein